MEWKKYILVLYKRLPELNWDSLIKNVLFLKNLVTMKKINK